MVWHVSFPYQGTSRYETMDMMFFIGVNIALLGLLVYGLMTAKEKIKAGRKEIV